MSDSGAGDWLQLTEADIERARRLPFGAESMAGVLRITEEDLAPVPPIRVVSAKLGELEQLSFQLINQYRSQQLPSWLPGRQIIWDERLAAVARGHATDMLRRNYIDHISPEGVSLAGRMGQAGISYIGCGENIGVAYGVITHSGRGIVDIHHAFINQPLGLKNHRANLLNPIWQVGGVGVQYNSGGSLILVQLFGLC